MREKLSLPIGIRGPFGSAKAPPAARSDNALRKERGGRRTRIRAEPPARALRDGREKSTRGHCAAGGKNQPAGVARRAGKINPRALRGKREQSAPAVPYFCFSLPCPASPPFIAPRRSRQRGSRRPSRGAGECSRLTRRVFHRPMPILPKSLAPTFPQGARLFTPRAACLSLSMPIPPKSRAPTFPRGGRLLRSHASRPGAQKNGAEAPFFCCLLTPWNR